MLQLTRGSRLIDSSEADVDARFHYLIAERRKKIRWMWNAFDDERHLKNFWIACAKRSRCLNIIIETERQREKDRIWLTAKLRSFNDAVLWFARYNRWNALSWIRVIDVARQGDYPGFTCAYSGWFSSMHLSPTRPHWGHRWEGKIRVRVQLDICKFPLH